MSAHILLKIEGIKGDSKIEGHTDEIDILSASWGADNPSSAHHGGGAGIAKVNVHDLSVTKRVDKASPELFKQMCSGKHFDKATLIFHKAGGDAPVDYMKYEMEHVFVTSLQQSGGGDQFPLENVSLSFEKFVLTFTGQDEKGAPTTPSEVTWDIAKNK